MEKSQPTPEFTPSDKEEIQKNMDAVRDALVEREGPPKEQDERTQAEESNDSRIDEIKAEIQQEEKLGKEAGEIKKELEEMPTKKLEEIGIGLRNFGFFAKEYKSKMMAGIFESAGDKEHAQEAEGFTGSIKRWMQGYSQSYRKDEEAARKSIEETKEFELSLKQVGNVGFVAGETTKHGRTVADVLGWTAGSPLRYAMFGAQIFARGAGAAKEARLMNAEVIDKTRIQEMAEAAEEAWKIYENAQAKAEEKGGVVSKQDLEKSYVGNLPADLLKRLEKAGPGTATGTLQWFLRKDLEFAIKHGKIKIGKDGQVEKLFENSFNDRLKEYDRLVTQYGTVDALAMGAKYAETAGKAVIAAVSIETATLGAKALFDRFPDIMSRLAKTAGGALAGGFVGKKVGGKKGAIVGAAVGAMFGASGMGMDEENIGDSDSVLTEYQEGKRFPMGERPEEIPAPAPVSGKLGEIEESFIVQKGEGVSDALLRQLSDDPENFGFTGDSKDDGAVTEWARSEVKNIVTGGGYWVQGTGDGVGVSGVGGDAAYEIEKGSDGSLKINTYLKNDAGDFVKTETREVLKDLEKAQLKTNIGPREYMRYGEPKKPIAAPVTVIEAPTKEALIVPEPSGETTAEYQPPIYDTPKSALGSDTLEKGEVYAEGVEEPTQKYTYNMPKGIDYDQALSVAEKQVHNEINTILGSKGFLGFGVKAGMASPDWNDKQVGFANATVENVMFPETHTYGGDKTFGIKDSSATKEWQKLLTQRFNETKIQPKPGEKMGEYLTRTLAEKMGKRNALLTEVPIEPANIQEPEKGLPEERQKTDAEIKRDLKAWAREFDKDKDRFSRTETPPVEQAPVEEGLPQEQQKTDAEIKRDLKKWARENDTDKDRFSRTETPPAVEQTPEVAPEVTVEKITTNTETGEGKIVETTGVTAEVKGSTGQEFLSKDYMLKLKPSAAGTQFARTEAMMTSRNISAQLAAYHKLLSEGREEEAMRHLSALRWSIDTAERTLGEGVIDRSKIPELKK